MTKENLQKELETLEAEMLSATFWSNKDKAQATIRRIAELKAEIAGEGKYDAGDAVVTIFSGAGGDDAAQPTGVGVGGQGGGAHVEDQGHPDAGEHHRYGEG